MRHILWIILVVILTLSLVGCSPDRGPDLSKIHDNGKNLAYIETSDISESIYLIQLWIDKNPSKRLVALSSDSLYNRYGRQGGWIIVYEPR